MHAYLIAILREIHAHGSENDFKERLTAHSQPQCLRCAEEVSDRDYSQIISCLT